MAEAGARSWLKDPFLWLLVLVPIAVLVGYVFHAGPIAVFGAAVLAIVPLAEWIRRATEQVAHRAGPGIGGLLQVSFGNAAELILAIFILAGGNESVVKAQITGSLIGNALLGLGLAALIGGWGRGNRRFSRARAGMLSTMLILVTIALLVPALFDYTERGIFATPNPGLQEEKLSLGVSVVLIVIYSINLIRSLLEKRDTFSVEEEHGEGASAGAPGVERKAPRDAEAWPLWRSIAILVAATIATAVVAEEASGALDAASAALGMSTFFLGVIVLAVVGNASEYLSAVYFARRNQMDLTMTITLGSTIQVALLLAPILVIVSFLMGKPMNLVFTNPLELIAIASTAFIVNAIAEDGETTWFEGLLLLAVYLLLALAFFFATP